MYLSRPHEMGFARDVTDEICFLHDGRILERGKPARLLSHPEQPETQRFLRRLLEADRL
jgi:polar amino acid transport system ATP-binding protein